MSKFPFRIQTFLNSFTKKRFLILIAWFKYKTGGFLNVFNAKILSGSRNERVLSFFKYKIANFQALQSQGMI